MAVTFNTYVGNGSTVLYPFTFPYLARSDVYASINDLPTTEFTFDNATTIRFNTPPADGARIRIYRQTANDELVARFVAGSAIRAKDLNDDFEQIIYKTQESTSDSDIAIGIANAAAAAAQGAVNTVNAAMPKAGGTFTGDVTFNTSIKLPAGTTAQRPIGAAGVIRFNTETNQYEGYTGTAWSSIGGGAKGAGSDQVFFENDQVVTASYTLTTGKNAVTAGPVTIANGAVVTIPSNQSWSIV